MSLQNEDGHGAVIKAERAACPYKNLSHKFKEKKRDFKAQYAHIYFARLQKMKASLQDSAKRKWGELHHRSLSSVHRFSRRDHVRNPFVFRRRKHSSDQWTKGLC